MQDTDSDAAPDPSSDVDPGRVTRGGPQLGREARFTKADRRAPTTGEPCCPMMDRQLRLHCTMHKSPWKCPDNVVVRANDGMYGLPVRTGKNSSASSFVVIWHCPWCAAPLPGHQTHPASEGEEAVGKALTEDEVDRRTNAWHNGAGGTAEFHEYLGWTWDEYCRWEDNDELPSI